MEGESYVPPTIFGRLYAPDPRDRGYAMPKMRTAAIRMERHWKVGPITDQGSVPSCVGHAWSQFLRSAPVMDVKRQLPLPDTIYEQAQKVDEWPGENYAGTSLRAGAKVLMSMGLITEYFWAGDIDTVKNYLLTRGPVVVGTDWFEQMSRPRWMDSKKQKGTMNDAYLEPTGPYLGGHAYLLVGYSKTRRAFRMVNSWAEKYGEKGRAWIAYDVMDYLIFRLNGEACSALET